MPRPSPTEYKDTARDSARTFGWEFITDRQRAVLEDEADQLRDSKGTLAAKIKRIQEGAPLSSCSFCGKTQDQVHTLVAGSGAFICDECVDIAAKMIEKRKNAAGPVAEGEGENAHG